MKLIFKYIRKFLAFIVFGIISKEKKYYGLRSESEQNTFYSILAKISNDYYKCDLYKDNLDGLTKISITSRETLSSGPSKENKHVLTFDNYLIIKSDNTSSLILLQFLFLGGIFELLTTGISFNSVLFLLLGGTARILMVLYFFKEQGRLSVILEQSISEYEKTKKQMDSIQ